MYINSKFVEIMKLFPREIFKESVARHKGDRYAKNFSSYSHLIAMIYGHLSEANSLRNIEIGYNQHGTAHHHLQTNSIKRSTLSDANSRRNPQIFLDVASHIMSSVSRTLRKELSSIVKLIDSTSISLIGCGFDEWTKDNRTCQTQGLKLHLGYELTSKMPYEIEFSNANVNDITVSKEWPIEEGVIYVFDKGYYDYNWWNDIAQSGASFVTRLKSNSAVKVVKENSALGKNILADEEIVFTNLTPRGGKKNLYTNKLRRITVDRPDKDTPIILVTNRFDLSAVTIANLYKQRWQIELMFKWLKQHLKIKKFIGKNENAVKIQIITALITYMLLAIYKRLSQTKSAMYEFLILVKSTLFYNKQKNYYKEKQRQSRFIAENQLELCYV